MAVVVPAFNEEKVIVRTVRSLLASHGPPFEIVIVDDGSPDETYEVVTEAFRDEPSLRIVRASTREVYGDPPALPPNAAVYFSGVDEQVGPLTKYALTEAYADAR